MLRITRQADYALVLLTQFASGGQGVVHTARELAEHAALPLPTVSKILKALARGGLLSSLRGVNGGYRLGRSAQAISVADVIGAIDGPIAFTECLSESPDPGTPCAIRPSCPTHTHWVRINRVVADALAHLPLAEVARPPARVSDALVSPVLLAGRGVDGPVADATPSKGSRS
jgi:FeS assembly SUF system regulator